MTAGSSATAQKTAPIGPLDIHTKARINMVECQLRPNRVTDSRLLAAMAEVPREKFVPESLAAVAYVDDGLPIGGGRQLMEPMVLGRLLQEAEIGPEDKVLVVGCNAGYSAAVLSHLAASVTAVECDADLAAKAKSTLAGTGVAVVTGALEQGWAAAGPYDVILIDGAIAEIPAAIADQLSPRGRIVAIKSQEGRTGAGMFYRKLGGSVSGRVLFDAVAPFLPGFAPRPAFVF